MSWSLTNVATHITVKCTVAENVDIQENTRVINRKERLYDK